MPRTFTLAAHGNTPPTPWSYWVVEGQLLAGAFPGSPDPTDHRQKIKTLVDAGIRTIINLMEESRARSPGPPISPAYEQIAAQLADPEVIDCSRYSIPDVSVPQPTAHVRDFGPHRSFPADQSASVRALLGRCRPDRHGDWLLVTAAQFGHSGGRTRDFGAASPAR